MPPSSELWRELHRPAAQHGVSLKGLPGLTTVTRVLSKEEHLAERPLEAADALARCAAAARASSAAAPPDELHSYLASFNFKLGVTCISSLSGVSLHSSETACKATIPWH